jgi:hypothetical protein
MGIGKAFAIDYQLEILRAEETSLETSLLLLNSMITSRKSLTIEK